MLDKKKLASALLLIGKPGGGEDGSEDGSAPEDGLSEEDCEKCLGRMFDAVVRHDREAFVMAGKDLVLADEGKKDDDEDDEGDAE